MTDDLPSLVVGLGNPGQQYAQTRHNVGWFLVDRLLAKFPSLAAAQHLADSELWECRWAGRSVRLAKPLTYMNDSGRAVAALARRYQLRPTEILVLYDEMDLPVGRLRLRHGGASGGHNGIESIIRELASADFGRVRIGIGRVGGRAMVDHVLNPFSPAERNIVEQVLEQAEGAVQLAVRRGLGPAMSHYNSVNLEPREPSAKSEEAQP